MDIQTAMVNMGWVLHDQGLRAFGTLTSNGTNVSNGNVVNIGSKTYTFRTTLTPTEGEVKIGGSASATLDNLKAAINHTGTPDTDYCCAAANTEVTAEDKTDTTLKIQSIIYGSAGRYAFSKTATNLSVSGATLTGNTYTVYKSNGEDGNRPYGYVGFDYYSTSSIYLYYYLYWDASAHTGTLPGYATNVTIGTGSADTVDVFGDKNLVYIATLMLGSYTNAKMFGHFSTIQTQITNTTDAITTGSHVSIPVSSSSGFSAGMVIQIVGLSEGRDKLTIESIPDATHIQVISVPRNYASGAFIGAPAMCFGMIAAASPGGDFYEVAQWSQSGLTACAVGDKITATMPISNNAIDPESQSGFYILCPIWMNYASHGFYATMGTRFLATYGASVKDVLGINADNSKSVSNSCTSATGTTLVDSSKAWETDALIGKYVVISDGTGVGQTRKILDNDATSLTVVAWLTQPDATSTYRIVDQVWRVLNSASCVLSNLMVAQETEHSLT
jgi:hypothetical protein